MLCISDAPCLLIFCTFAAKSNSMKSTPTEQSAAFLRLLKIMDEFREQCPWDKKQTLESLRHLSLEEVYVLSDAILKNDLPEIEKELGDVLLHIVFYARLGTEQNAFDITSVMNKL